MDTKLAWKSAWAWARLIAKDGLVVLDPQPILIMARIQLNERERFS